MPGKPQRGTVIRAFMNKDRTWGCAVEFEGGQTIRADTHTRLEPGSEVEATYRSDRGEWVVKLLRAVA
jgi:hypothetical protein